MYSTSNLATPGLINLNTPKPITNGNQSVAQSAVASNPFLAGGNPTINMTNTNTGGSTTQPFATTPGITQAGVQLPSNTPQTLATSSTPLINQNVAYTLNGKSYNSNGDVVTPPTTLPNPSNNVQASYIQNNNPTAPSIVANGGGSAGNTAGSGATSPAVPTPAQVAANTYNGGVNSSGQTLNGYGSTPPTLQGLVSSLATTANGQSDQYTKNQNNSQTAQQGLISNTGISPQEQSIMNQENDLGKSFNLSNMNAGAYEPGLTMAQVGGQQGALLSAYNTGLQNLQTQEGQAQTQQGLAQSGYQQAGGLANTAAGNATSQQGTQQSGLASAGTLASPQTQYGALTNPLTGDAISGSNGSVLPASAQSAIALEAQKVQNNQETYAQAQSNLSAYGQNGVNALNQTLGPNFNANTNAGASSAQSSNTATAGTASTSANQAIYQQQLSSAANTLQQTQAIQSSAQQLISSMPSLGINLTPSQLANTSINQLSTQFSSGQYSQFNANIANLQAKVGALLQQGEIPTSAGAAAQSIINGSLNVGALTSTLNQVLLEAQQQAVSQASTASTAYGNIQSNANTNGSSTNSTTANPWH
jgi:hypothetical protein